MALNNNMPTRVKDGELKQFLAGIPMYYKANFVTKGREVKKDIVHVEKTGKAYFFMK